VAACQKDAAAAPRPPVFFTTPRVDADTVAAVATVVVAGDFEATGLAFGLVATGGPVAAELPAFLAILAVLLAAAGRPMAGAGMAPAGAEVVGEAAGRLLGRTVAPVAAACALVANFVFFCAGAAGFFFAAEEDVAAAIPATAAAELRFAIARRRLRLLCRCTTNKALAAVNAAPKPAKPTTLTPVATNACISS